MKTNSLSQRIGILGGGQLGKMLGISAQPLDLDLWIMDRDISFPAGHSCKQFVAGDINDYESVVDFGKQVDIVTIEIEGVNLEALFTLQDMGKKVYPPPQALQIIKDKGLQKTFYRDHNFPTSDFTIYDDWHQIIQDLDSGHLNYPFVQKSRQGGYDGRGVSIIRSAEDLNSLLQVPSLVEKMVDIRKEIGLIVARNPSGQIETFDPVEMVFDPEANLVDYLFGPADLSEETMSETISIATRLIDQLDMVGLLAVEFFEDSSGKILINEVAPRPHNSGHHSIEACVTSQFQQHLRAILDLPLGSTKLQKKAIMVNILGADGYQGKPIYDGIDKILDLDQVYIHIYGKTETRPARKMGHITILTDMIEAGLDIKKRIQTDLKVIAKNG